MSNLRGGLFEQAKGLLISVGFRFDDFLEGEMTESVSKNFCKRSGDEIVDYTTSHHEPWLPSAIYYLVKCVLENLSTEQQIRDVKFHVPDCLHINVNLHLVPWSPSDGTRLYEIVWIVIKISS